MAATSLSKFVIENARQYPDPEVVFYGPTVMEIYMRKRGLSQKELGREVGRDQTLISWYMNRVKEPDEVMTTKIARVLGIGRPELLLTVWNATVDYGIAQ